MLQGDYHSVKNEDEKRFWLFFERILYLFLHYEILWDCCSMKSKEFTFGGIYHFLISLNVYSG